MDLLNSFFCCCYWCGSPMGGLHGEEPFEESLKGSCVHLPRHSSAAWREFLHDPAFIFFSLWCLSYCRQGRIRSVFPKINWFGCLLEHRATPGSHLDFAGWAAGLVLRQQEGQGSLLSHLHSPGALFKGSNSQGGSAQSQAGQMEPSFTKQKSKKWMTLVKERNGNVF